MFTYMKLKNFKSFGDVYFDFRKTKKEPKKLVAIYGENGCGKSNFVEAFDLLARSVTSFSMRHVLEDFLDKRSDSNFEIKKDLIERIIGNSIFDCSNYRMIDCNEPTTVECGFEIEGKEGYYKLSFNDTIEFEELYFLVGTKRGKLYTISGNNNEIMININNSIFSSEYCKEFEKELKKFWGKNTFLAIFFNEMMEKNDNYISENVFPSLEKVIEMFNQLFIVSKNNMRTIGHAISNYSPFLSSGKIFPDDEPKLDNNICIIRSFFTQLYSDIKDVYYEKNRYEDRIEYKLHVKKIIAGKIRDVLFDMESSGTQKTLEIVNAIIAVVNGCTVIYDEIDEGIHDLLMKSIISSLISNAAGQLIITTHNTLLLETIEPQSAYVIYVDCDGNKEARCCADYGIRVQKTHNMRNQYLKGMFGGIPYASEIDFSFMAHYCENGGDDNEE